MSSCFLDTHPGPQHEPGPSGPGTPRWPAATQVPALWPEWYAARLAGLRPEGRWAMGDEGCVRETGGAVPPRAGWLPPDRLGRA